MLLVELLSLMDWFEAEEKENGFLKKLTALQQILNSNIQAQGNRNMQFQSFTAQKNEAISSLSKVDLPKLSDIQLDYLELYGIPNHVGHDASISLKESFRDEKHDIAYLLNVVTEYMQSIQKFKDHAKAISSALQPYRNEVKNLERLDKPRFSIIFKNNASIDNLSDLEKSSKEWKQIIHSLSKGLDLNEEDFEIIGTRNGSIVIDLLVVAAAMKPLSIILNSVFEIIERFVLMRKRITVISESDPTDEAYQQVEGEIKSVSEKYFNISKNISSEKLAKEILNDIPDSAEKNERITFLESSIKKILNHLKNGGDLDIFIPRQLESSEDTYDETESDKEDVDVSKKNIQNFRKVKKKLDIDEVVGFLRSLEFDETREDE